MKNFKILLSGFLFGVGLGMGFIPILIASAIMKKNLYVELIDRMDKYWVTEID